MAAYRNRGAVCAVRICFQAAESVTLAQFAPSVRTVGIVDIATKSPDLKSPVDLLHAARKRFPTNIPFILSVDKTQKKLAREFERVYSLCNENDSTWFFLI